MLLVVLLLSYAGTDTLCLPTGCYDVTVGGGSFLYEVSFNFGTLVGSPADFGAAACSQWGTPCEEFLGCTDSTATNYDATATVDDGSCTYCTGTFANINVGGGSWLSEVSWTRRKNSLQELYLQVVEVLIRHMFS